MEPSFDTGVSILSEPTSTWKVFVSMWIKPHMWQKPTCPSYISAGVDSEDSETSEDDDARRSSSLGGSSGRTYKTSIG